MAAATAANVSRFRADEAQRTSTSPSGAEPAGPDRSRAMEWFHELTSGGGQRNDE